MSLNLKFIEKYNYKQSKRALLRAALWGGLTAYMGYHLLQGNRGLLALIEIKQIVKKEQQILDKLENERKVLHRKIELLRPKSLDLDLLDERARDILNVAEKDEIILDVDEILKSATKANDKPKPTSATE